MLLRSECNYLLVLHKPVAQIKKGKISIHSVAVNHTKVVDILHLGRRQIFCVTENVTKGMSIPRISLASTEQSHLLTVEIIYFQPRWYLKFYKCHYENGT